MSGQARVEHADPLATVAAIWRIEAATVTAALTRRTGDLALAEDLAQEAVLAAVEQWPRDGVPPHPGAWLMTVAQRRLADHARRRDTERRKLDAIRAEADPQEVDMTASVDDPFVADSDDELRLFFLCCHPALTPGTQVALTLRSVGGMSSEAIAKAFLTPTTTMQQRLTRAKKTLKGTGARFELPPVAELGARLGAVLAVVYAVFTEGHAATSGDHHTRPELCHEALRMARRLTHLAPTVSEVHALASLLELQASRLPARTGPDGRAVLLEDQDRTLWDRHLIERGLAGLDTARPLAGDEPGNYLLQAEIAACHARARRTQDTDWRRIADTYSILIGRNPSPAVALAYAVAVGRADGPDAALPLLTDLERESRLADYPYLHAALADTYQRLGRLDEARRGYLRAEELSRGTPAADRFGAAAARVERGGDGDRIPGGQ